MSKQTWNLPNEWEIAPFFQPIISFQTQQIFGYEILGRRFADNQIYSLGPFFQNPNIQEGFHIRIDRYLREKAFQYLSVSNTKSKLFINLKPVWIFRYYNQNGTLPTLQLLQKYQIDPSNIIIEITEGDFDGDLQELSTIIAEYRKVGCTIAIDDVGSGFSNFDRIALLQPKILKIDMNIVKKSNHHDGYQALLRSFSILATQIGASLLLEGVETVEDLQNALSVGARFIQGFLFSQAVPEFLPSNSYLSFLREEMDHFKRNQFSQIANIFGLSQYLNQLLSITIPTELEISTSDEADRIIENILPKVGNDCFRIYICREDGYQISSNFHCQKGGKWEPDSNYRGANWIWRPYFISNILTMKYQNRGILSQVYQDLDTSNSMVTYSYPIADGLYLFMDFLFVV